jgi:outer membrane protein assembly factor BamB
MSLARLVLLAFLLSLSAAVAEDKSTTTDPEPGWPRFRGPNGTGIAISQAKLPLPWDKKHVLWKVPVPGGNGSPIVLGERIFLTTASNDGSQRHLLCLNVKDGKERWKKTYPGGRAKTHLKNSLASGTPCTDGERVYLTVWNGRELLLVACNLEGKEVWQRNLGSFRAQHGAGHSPVVENGKVYLVKDDDNGAAVHSFEAEKGKPLWTKERKVFNACYSTPFLRPNGSGLELVVASTAGVTGYHADTGDISWNWNWDWSDEKKELRTVGSPIAVGNMVVATSGDGGGARCAIALKLGGKGELSNSDLAWKSRRLVPYVPTFLAWDEHLYFVNDQGVAGCLDAKKGTALWSRRVCGAVTASPILIDGKIIAIDEDGQAVILAATPKECKVLGQRSLGEPVMASPAIASGRLYIRGKEHLFCIGLGK